MLPPLCEARHSHPDQQERDEQTRHPDERFGIPKRTVEVTHVRRRSYGSYNGHQGGHMRISTVREFRDKATGLVRSRTPILVTRRGRLAGIFFPRPEITLPIELKRELYDMLSSDVARQL